ncbi:hypothetical protein ACMD2_17070 [Ananas comosus]|uniref:SAM domain-containing protein n=1 Tax=Ananas comosus TaxID=4615 RepID=A0A199US76_ANACO|nr:hypothetical protein ACMD2_17070 [Ananas comosus]
MEEPPPPELSASAAAAAAMNGGSGAAPDLTAAATAAAAAAAAAATSKRQRRPSVRLGDIGEAPASSSFPYDPSHLRRTKPSKPSSSKPRHAPSSSAAAATVEDRALLPVDENLEPLGAALRRATREARARRRRPRSSWFAAAAAESHPNGTGGFADDDAYRKVEGDEARVRVRVFESREGGAPPATDPVEGDTPSGSDGEDWNDRNGQWRSVEDAGGVQSWLDRLGLGRYGLVFEIHEVDDEVLPLLTLEDLKDMGINAVGSRRKLYCAIQNLKKEKGIS